MAEPPQTTMEHRAELMVSPKGGKPTSKLSHFIKPTLGLTDTTPELPSIPLLFRPISPKCTFNGWRNPTTEWISWVDRLHSSCQFIWKRAGIYEAVLSSRYKISKNEELFFGLAERWCSETNTFVFPWGEATVTLEDVNVLGGYSVLGDSVSGSADDEEVNEVERKMVHFHKQLSKESSQKVIQGQWVKHFMGTDTGIEHEAFLALWLSRFVLPTFPFDTVSKRFFRIAIFLARGAQIALAPVVLASIYRDLSLLKSVMQSGGQVKGVDKDDGFNDLFMVTLWAPLQLVQVWAWERFPEFRPKPGVIEYGEPRLARWHVVNEKEIGNVRPLLQSAGDTFEWRPYCKAVDHLPFPAFYREKEEWVFVGEDLGEYVKVIVRFLRVSELVGTDFIEQYNPHRVAMQFGFDQDVPQHVRRYLMGSGIPKRELVQLAWLSYTNPIGDRLLYVPPMSYQPHVTMRYLKWLREGPLAKRAAVKGVVRRRRSLRGPRSRSSQQLKRVKIEVDNPPATRPRIIVNQDTIVPSDLRPKYAGNDLVAPPGFPPKLNSAYNEVHLPAGLTSRSIVDNHIDVPPGFVPKNVGNDLDVPPRFVPKNVGNDLDMPPGSGPKNVGIDPYVPPGFPQQCNVPKIGVDRKHGTVLESIVKVKQECVESTEKGQPLLSCSIQILHTSPATTGTNPVMQECDRESEQRSSEIAPNVTHGRRPEMDVGSSEITRLDMEARISQLEKIVAALKQSK